ncbi:type I-E CRISPR-associated protein Cas5/CasD [Streptomyces sp. NPDC056488]|uniref:type I-E CRISPR-associated protein Cas5/CasD n=1 Tax=Streptomyces sp. NPDC056488 TaxID=3345836 RepID=UPI0036A3FF6A
MSTLTLLLAGPLQSWGAAARFSRRTTEPAPTKSAVVGLLASAQGIQRGDDEGLRPLSALRFGVRIDQPGTRLRDFQTAIDWETEKSMPLSERFYLADAVFVAAVEGPPALLADLHQALRTPAYPPFLGRRSCPPARPLELGLHPDKDLLQALRHEPWQASPHHTKKHTGHSAVKLPVLYETAGHTTDTDTLRDQPVSFAAEHRRHALRTIVRTDVELPTTATPPRHDPFDALPEESR